MTPDKTVIYSDLDGTLFNSRGVVSAENRAAIDAYLAAGGRFAICTGREPKNALHFIGDLPQNTPAVVVNGCGVFDFAASAYRRMWTLDRARLIPALRGMLAEVPDLELQAYTEAGICYCTPEETAHPQLRAMHDPCVFTTLDAVADAPILKCFVFAPEEREELLLRCIRRGEAAGLWRHVPGTTDVGGPITYHEMLPPDVSKGSAIRFLRTLPDLAGRTVIGVGDYWNDYELLEEADVAVAPANAIDEIKALCGYTTVSNNEHVIKHIVEDILPLL